MIALDSQWNTYKHGSKTLLYKGNVNMKLTDLCTTLDNEVFPLNIRGNFSFVFLSDKKNVIFAAVDHFATYPLFYSDTFISQYFNDIKNALSSYSTNIFITDTIKYFGGYSVGPETSITEINRLQPGHYLHNGVQIKYMDILISNMTEGDYTINARDALIRNIDTITNEITNGANLLLSGGKDSTLLLKLFLDSNANINPISLISDYQIFSERKIVSEICTEYNIVADIKNIEKSGIYNFKDTDFSGFWIDSTFSPKYTAKDKDSVITGECGTGVYSINPLITFCSQKPRTVTEICEFLVLDISRYHKEQHYKPISNESLITEYLVNHFKKTFTESNLSLDNKLLHLPIKETTSYRLFLYSQDKNTRWYHPFTDWEFINYTVNCHGTLKVSNKFDKELYIKMFPNISKTPWKYPKNGLSIPPISKY